MPDKINPKIENNNPKGTVRILIKQDAPKTPNTNEEMPEILYTLKRLITLQRNSLSVGVIYSRKIEITSRYNYW